MALRPNGLGIARPRRLRRWLLLLGAALLGPTLALALPGPTSCALLELGPFDVLEEGTLVEHASTPAERTEVRALRREASARITRRFGALQAKPHVVFVKDPSVFFPFLFNAYGSTHFIGTRACVVVGPEGWNVDVAAHELMHCEIAARVGAWRRQWLPTWFDEGLAMQVDTRTSFSAPGPAAAPERAMLRTLTTGRAFFRGDDATLTRHYQLANEVVGEWLKRLGDAELDAQFRRLHDGAPLELVVP